MTCIVLAGCLSEKSLETPVELQESQLESNASCTPEDYAPLGGIIENYICLRPGDSKEAIYVFYSGNWEGKVELSVHRVDGVLKTQTLPTPEGVNISVEPDEFFVKPEGKYMSRITVSVSQNFSECSYGNNSIKLAAYVFLIRAEIGNETIDDWLRVDVYPLTDKPVFVPGRSLMDMATPRLSYSDRIALKRGETAELQFTLYTGEAGPGNASFTVFRVAEGPFSANISSMELLPMPEGLSVGVEPQCCMVKPHANYELKLVTKANSNVPAGRYFFCIHIEIENGVRGCHPLVIDVTD
ncbi:hypothetical protein [Archaeoglobus veneficus]|uniref:hypothetical protein n=1 Tax=Archaeoglobus veneficus TaxID=58290 RepID=UPI00064F3CFE|nr:hypothetical protein [Archaeoglobus veneficus]